MNASNRIQNATLNMNFDAQHVATEFEHEAYHWSQEQLLPRLAAIIERCIPPQQVVIVDKIILDLGQISATDYHRNLLYRLEQQLIDKLTALAGHTSPAGGTVIRLSLEDYDWQQLKHFLQTGQPTANFNPQSDPHGNALLTALQNHQQRLVKLLQDNHTPLMLERLLMQLPTKPLIDFLQQLPPPLHHQAMVQLLNHPADLSLHTVEGQYWSQWLDKTLRRGQITDLVPLWEGLLTRFANVLIQALHRYAHIPAQLVKHLTTPARLALVGKLAPSDYPFLHRLLETPELWEVDAARTSTEANQRLWLFTLSFLLIERGSRFNKQQYMHSLLLQMAAADNIDVQAMIQRLQRTLACAPIDSALRQQLSQLLEHLHPQLTTPVPQKIPDIDIRNWLERTLLEGDIAPYLDELIQHHSQVLQDTLRAWGINPAIEPQIWQHQSNATRLRLRSWLDKTATVTEAPSRTDREQHAQQRSDPSLHPVSPALQEWLDSLIKADESAVNTLLATPHPHLAALLRWLGQLAFVRRRWADTLSVQTLKALTESINRSAADEVAHQSLAVSITNTDDLTQLWVIALDLLLTQTYTAADAFKADLLAKWSAATGQISQSVSARITNASSTTGLPTLASAPELSQLFAWQQQCSPESGTPDIWIALIQRLMTPESGRGLEAIHKALKVIAANELAILIQQLGQHRHLRQQWSKHLRAKELVQLVQLSVPTATSAVVDITSNPQRFNVSKLTADASTRTQTLWEFTLSYLFVERGGHFNRRSYLRSLTRQLAAHYNLAHITLINALIRQPNARRLWADLFTDLEQSLKDVSEAENWLSRMQQGREANAPPADQVAAIRQLLLASPQDWPLLALAREQQQRILELIVPNFNAHIRPIWSSLITLTTALGLPPFWLQDTLLTACPASGGQWRLALLKALQQLHPAIPWSRLDRQLSSVIDTLPTNTQRFWQREDRELDAAFNSWQVTPSKELPTTLAGLCYQQPARLWHHLEEHLQTPAQITAWIDAASDSFHIHLLASQRGATLDSLIRSLLGVLYLLDLSVEDSRHAVFTRLYYQLLVRGKYGNSLTLWQQIVQDVVTAPEIKQAIANTTLTTQLHEQLSAQLYWPQNPVSASPESPLPAQLDSNHAEIRRLAALLTPPAKQSRIEELPPENTNEIPDSNRFVVDNAGLVLCAHYLPMLLQRLKLTCAGKFVSKPAQIQALFCLQWLVFGENQAPEYRLLLNKLLCGVPLETPIPLSVELPPSAEETMEGLLHALINHWSALGHTSLEGLRQSFLRRPGELSEEKEQWQLQVWPQSFDMLLDRLPWSYQTIRLPWMVKPLTVSWR